MARREAATYTIAGECERLFCETLRSVFLGEGNQSDKDSLAMGMLKNDYGTRIEGYPSPEPEGLSHNSSSITDWIEMWDYVGGIRFRGFVAESNGEKAMFVFFDQSAVAGDLKAGLMALLELCELDSFACDRLVVCIDRHTDQTARDTLVKDLGWIGFGLTTLHDFSSGGDLTSDKWLFMDMET